MIWAVWMECNRRVFDNTFGDLTSVWESILFHVASWSKIDRSLSFYSFESLHCNLKALLLSQEMTLNFLLIYLPYADPKKKKKN